MSKSNNKRLSVHLRVYRGKSMTYNSKGESTNENHVVKLEYNTAEYKRFLSMLRSNGFIKADVEKVLDLSTKVDGKSKDEPGYYEEVDNFEDIQKEVDFALNPDGAEKELTPDQKRIADLEASNAEMKEALDSIISGKKDIKNIKVNDSKDVKNENKEPKKELTEDEKTELKTVRDQYVSLYGKKGHPGWSVEELKQKISEFKPETK